MKLCFIDEESLATLKMSLPSIVSNFAKDSGDWIEAKLGKNPYIETKFGEIPDFELDMSSDSPFTTEAKNAELVYKNLKFLSDSQASDERLWAALCLKDFWKYVQYRWIDGDVTESKVKQHFFFGFGARRSLTRNALSRLWWIGRLTYDESHTEDPFWLTKYLCENSDNIMNVLERNTSNSAMITRAFLSATYDAREKMGYVINTNTMGELEKYLNLLGGAYILDCMPEQLIYDKIMDKARTITERIRKQAEETERKKQEEAEKKAQATKPRNESIEKTVETPAPQPQEKPRSVLSRLFGGKR